jgi:hypothetical protein
MKTQHDPSQLHRLMKIAIDSGEVSTIAEAERLFSGYRLAIHVGKDVAHSPTLQASLLTAINTARRSFMGGVEISGDLDVPLIVPWRNYKTLLDAVIDLQGKPVRALTPEIPRIIIGDNSIHQPTTQFAVNVTFNGWIGGIVPSSSSVRLSQEQEFIPSGILAGALAVSEAFQFVRGDNPLAGQRAVGLSLWQPENSASWLESESGPQIRNLPANLWLIGLGHLGQAYLWTLGLLPYAFPNEVQIFLQDFDELESANESTSPLTFNNMVGLKKTRAMAAWCEERGFRPKIVERRFASNFNISDEEPRVALCGVDNLLARAALEDVGFDRIIEAGLGNGPQEFLTFQIHNLPSSRSAHDRWQQLSITKDSTSGLINQPAYQALAQEGYDECGLTLLAGRSVGASFVGAVTSTLVIAELLRMTMGENSYEVIDGDLRLSNLCQGVINSKVSKPFNPGLTVAQSKR